MKKKVSKKTFVSRRTLESIAEIERELGKGAILSIAAGIMLGKISFDPMDVTVCCAAFLIGAAFLKSSILKSRQAALLAYEEEL